MKKALRNITVACACAGIAWHTVKVVTQHDADKGGVFLVMIAAISILVVLYKTSRGE